MSASLKPESPWSLRVNDDGQPDPNGSWVARPPVPYHYKGTVRRHGIDDATAAREEQENRTLLDNATFIASQTSNARSLLIYAYRNGISFQFDHDKTSRQFAGAVNDYDPDTGKRTMILNPYVPPSAGGAALWRAGTISHELTHARRNQQKFLYNQGHTLASAIKITRAQEADAGVSGALVYAGLLMDSPDKPANVWKPPAIVAALEDQTPKMRAAILEGLPELKAGRTDRFAQHVFAVFYSGDEDTPYYDASTLQFFAKVGAQNRLANNTDYMTSYMRDDGVNHDRIAAILILNGKPYLTDAPFSLDDANFTALSNTPKVRAAFDQLAIEADRYRKLGYNPNLDIGFRPGTEQAKPAQNLRAVLPSAALGGKPLAEAIPA